MFRRRGVWLLVLLGCGAVAQAHHSFAVFFSDGHLMTVRGKVTAFQFRNPHGLIRIEASGEGFQGGDWRAETNSPSILERRGWSRDSLKAGDDIIIEGWPARDGSRYMRMRKVTRADGTPVGRPIDFVEQQ